MPKSAHSWSKPEGIPDLIGRKQVDWSVFRYGTGIPVEFYDDFWEANNGAKVSRGEQRTVTLLIQGKEYEARLVNANRRQVIADTLQLRYDSNQELLTVLRRLLKPTFDDLEARRNCRLAEGGKKPGVKAGGPSQAYLDFFRTGEPFRYRVEVFALPISDELSPLFERILVKGRESVRPGEPAKIPELEEAYEKVQSLLAASTEVMAGPSVKVSWSYGKGRLARIPWIALLDERETNTTRRGVYAVYLFREDMSGVYLAFHQGVTEPKKVHGNQSGLEWVHDRAIELRDRYQSLTGNGFHLDDHIDLRTEVGLGKDYEAATIAYKLYEQSKIPSDSELLSDLEAVLAAYDNYITGGEPPSSTEDPPTERRVVAISAGDDERWRDSLAGGYICTGWDEAGDLRVHDSEITLQGRLAGLYASQYPGGTELTRQWASELWTLRELKPGDNVVAYRGPTEVLAVGEVQSPGYSWNAGRDSEKHTVRVNWDSSVAKRVPKQRRWSSRTVDEVPDWLYRLIVSVIRPRLDLQEITRSFAVALQSGNINFGPRHDDVVRSFVASLATKRFAILTGLSGSGKTQIALRFGEWLGPGRRLLVPVRPDWTGPEPLFGYEDALSEVKDGHRAWAVPEILKFMLNAARDPEYPYLLILDEMNLAHVERYFADFLSGIESGEEVLPNLAQDPADGSWRLSTPDKPKLPIPENLFVVGTVNVDETTYMFSPKVLDRANTLEFRVETAELNEAARKPTPLDPGPDDLVRGFLAMATDDTFQQSAPHPEQAAFADQLRQVHQLLAQSEFEFGHRVFYEALRYASMLTAAGDARLDAALDQQIYQKVLPRLHGAKRRLDPLLCALAHFCWDLTATEGGGFRPSDPGAGQPRLPLAFRKLQRMHHNLSTNQFTSFTG